jgi:hypothetical protein
MALGFGKLQVLESKLNIYEDLSKEMLDKLERAVATISDNSNRVAIILERHENRLDRSEEKDLSIMRLIEKVEEKVDKLEGRVNQLQRFRWIAVGVVTAAFFLFNSSDFFRIIFESNSNNTSLKNIQNTYKIEKIV